MRPVDTAQGDEEGIYIFPGDVVRVLTKDGDRPTFRVVAVDEQALAGKDVRIAYEDMVFVEKRSVSGPRVAGGLAAGTMYVQIINAAVGLVTGGVVRAAFFYLP